MEHVSSEFCFGSDNASWGQATLDRIKRLETKDMKRLFRFKKRKRTKRDFGRILHKDGEGGKNDLDKDEAAVSICGDWRTHVESHGMGL